MLLLFINILLSLVLIHFTYCVHKNGSTTQQYFLGIIYTWMFSRVWLDDGNFDKQKSLKIIKKNSKSCVWRVKSQVYRLKVWCSCYIRWTAATMKTSLLQKSLSSKVIWLQKSALMLLGLSLKRHVMEQYSLFWYLIQVHRWSSKIVLAFNLFLDMHF